MTLDSRSATVTGAEAETPPGVSGADAHPTFTVNYKTADAANCTMTTPARWDRKLRIRKRRVYHIEPFRF